jgi:hypothetical protein
MKAVLRMITSLGLTGILFLIVTTGIANADSKPALSQIVSAGSYIVTINISKNPPFTGEPFDISVIPHDTSLKLSGKVIMEPGSGTNGVNIPTDLKASGDNTGTLNATVQIPVRGTWNIAIALNGPQGTGNASIPVTVGAPGAMPPWIAWSIGASPLLFIAFWIANQHRYRRKLITNPTSA